MKNKIILLVDDNPDDVLLTQRALKKNNIVNDIVVASDGVEALDFLFGRGKYSGRDLKQMPVLVLLDIKMPRMDGLEVLKHMRGNPATRLLPAVILTSSKEDSDIINSYNLGCNAYVRKPVDFDQFVDAVRQLGLFWLVLNEPPPVLDN
ncbi:MAG: response regulator [Dehalococcoidales bacterium]|jgi:CheY-like chemotaxis protein|nr:response regulator [Dehalococcoidales bacterium]